jgi:hypothetical protein
MERLQNRVGSREMEFGSRKLGKPSVPIVVRGAGSAGHANTLELPKSGVGI